MKLKFSADSFGYAYAIAHDPNHAVRDGFVNMPTENELILSTKEAAQIAQRIFDDYVAKCVRVYGSETVDYKMKSAGYRMWDTNYGTLCNNEPVKPTHQAFLIEVEEIPKKECEHKAAAPTAAAGIYFCIECDRKLKWTVVE